MQVFKNVLQMFPLAAHNTITSPKSASPEKKSYRVGALLVLSTLWGSFFNKFMGIRSRHAEVKRSCNRNPIHPMNNNNFLMVFTYVNMHKSHLRIVSVGNI